MKSLENWVHLKAPILNSGRTKHILPPDIPNQEEELDKLMQADPYIPRLRPLNEDDKFSGYETSWQIRTYGDEQPYAKEPPKEGTSSYSVIALRPFKWPGAITVFHNERWESLYVGDGIALGGDSFVPVSPEDVMPDPEDGIEQEEPNPKTELESLESDTDEEKKDEELKEDE